MNHYNKYAPIATHGQSTSYPKDWSVYKCTLNDFHTTSLVEEAVTSSTKHRSCETILDIATGKATLGSGAYLFFIATNCHYNAESLCYIWVGVETLETSAKDARTRPICPTFTLFCTCPVQNFGQIFCTRHVQNGV